MTLIPWASAVLCTDDDLRGLESNVLEWTGPYGSVAKWRAEAKKQITARLRVHFVDIDLQTTAAEPLDLIFSAEPLRYAAMFLSLYLLCNDCSTGPDQWAEKAKLYKGRFEEAWPDALRLISVDLDESGVMEESEQYNLNAGVKFKR